MAVPERDDVALLRAAADRLTDAGGAEALARAAGDASALLTATAKRLARDLATWEGMDRSGRSKMTAAEKSEKFFGPELNFARAVLSGNVIPLTSEQRLMIQEREVEIERLREVLVSVRGALMQGQDVELLQEYILHSVTLDGPRPLTSKQRGRLRKGEECPSEKKPFLGHRAAREYAETVVQEVYGVMQKTYQCRLCPCVHLASEEYPPGGAIT